MPVFSVEDRQRVHERGELLRALGAAVAALLSERAMFASWQRRPSRSCGR
jgi:hypothetical protein